MSLRIDIEAEYTEDGMDEQGTVRITIGHHQAAEIPVRKPGNAYWLRQRDNRSELQEVVAMWFLVGCDSTKVDW